MRGKNDTNYRGFFSALLDRYVHPTAQNKALEIQNPRSAVFSFTHIHYFLDFQIRSHHNLSNGNTLLSKDFVHIFNGFQTREFRDMESIIVIKDIQNAVSLLTRKRDKVHGREFHFH